MSIFSLTDPGEGLLEAVLVTWMVQVGDEVQVNDVICEVETAKSLIELPSPWTGTVRKLLVREGENVPVGTPLIDISVPGEADSPEELLVGYGPTERPSRRQATTTGAPITTPPPDEQPDLAPTTELATPLDTPRPRAKPPVRRLARDAGVDLNTITGTGPNGVITRSDVLAVATAQQPVETRVTLTGIRRGMAHTMTAALDVPHATVWRDVDLSRTLDFVAALKARPEFQNAKVSPLLIFCKAVCLGLSRYPELNASYNAAKHELRLKARVNLGIATATDRGLIVPNIKHADDRPLVELNRELTRIVTDARSGTTTAADTKDGSFTVTNVGVLGIDSGTPILNISETGIACLGAIRKRPWVVDDEIVIRPIATIALGFDHRVIDGETGARFLADLAIILEDPAMVLAMS